MPACGPGLSKDTRLSYTPAGEKANKILAFSRGFPFFSRGGRPEFRAGAGKFLRARPKMFPGMTFFVLAIFGASAIMRVKNKKCGSFWGSDPPKACTGDHTTYTTAPGRTARTILYSFSPGNARGFPCIPPREILYFVVSISSALGVGVSEGIFAS